MRMLQNLFFLIFFFCSNAFCLNYENRIIMDEDFLWLTPKKADLVIDRIKEAGFNILIPCIWHGRGAAWQSLLAPMEPRWEREVFSSRYDPLAYLIQSAKRAGIEIHPSFTISLRQRDFLKDYYDENCSPVRSFDFHRVEFQEYMIKLISEVVSKYDIQGVNLDYVRTKGTCTCDRCVRDYALSTGRDLVNDTLTEKRSPSAHDSLVKWKSASVERFLRNLKMKLMLIKKDIIISCDSHPGRKSFFIEGADSVQWLNSDLCDYVLDMNYGAKLNIKEFNSVKSRVVDPSRIIIMVGNYEKSGVVGNQVIPRSASLLGSLISTSKLMHPTHVATAVYCYKLLDDSQVDMLKSTVYKDPALPRWKPVAN